MQTPPDFHYRAAFVTVDEERALVALIERIPFSRVEMRGGVARRRTAHYGLTYAYDARRTEPGEPIPDFLLPLRARAADWAGIPPDDFVEALITEYTAGAGIGWHRDAPMFGDVIAGVSLLGSSRMRFRPYISPTELATSASSPPRRATHDVTLEGRSGYLITGAARREYEHSIPAVERLRYSVTFRTLRRSC